MSGISELLSPNTLNIYSENITSHLIGYADNASLADVATTCSFSLNANSCNYAITSGSSNTSTACTQLLIGDIGGTLNGNYINPGKIYDANISITANISDSKLNTIASSGKVANSATSAVTTNNPNTIVLRDSIGTINCTQINFGISNLGTYEEFSTVNTQLVTLTIIKIGKYISIHIKGNTLSTLLAPIVFDAIPSRFFPTQSVRNLFDVLNITQKIGTIVINTSGIITLYGGLNNDNFLLGSVTFLDTVITYNQI